MITSKKSASHHQNSKQIWKSSNLIKARVQFVWSLVGVIQKEVEIMQIYNRLQFQYVIIQYLKVAIQYYDSILDSDQSALQWITRPRNVTRRKKFMCWGTSRRTRYMPGRLWWSTYLPCWWSLDSCWYCQEPIFKSKCSWSYISYIISYDSYGTYDMGNIIWKCYNLKST